MDPKQLTQMVVSWLLNAYLGKMVHLFFFFGQIRESRMGSWNDGEPSVLAGSGGSVFTVPKEIYKLTDFIAARFEEVHYL